MKCLGMVIRLIIPGGEGKGKGKRVKEEERETKRYCRDEERYNGVGNKRRIKQRPDEMHGG